MTSPDLFCLLEKKKGARPTAASCHQALRRDCASIFFAFGCVLDSLAHLHLTLSSYLTTRTPLFAASRGSNRPQFHVFLVCTVEVSSAHIKNSVCLDLVLPSQSHMTLFNWH